VLGRFLEYSLATPDIRASFEFYAKLGFTQAQVGETWSHPYAVVTDGRIHLGLHQADLPAPSLTFVRPDLLRHLPALESAGVQFDYRCLGNDVFNEVGWFDPAGHAVRLIEARTFSPVKHSRSAWSRCGYFVEVALPAADLERAKKYWETFGFVGMDEPDDLLPHVACTSDHIELGFYDPAELRRPALRFEVEDLRATVASLGGDGLATSNALPALNRNAAAVFAAPEGTLLLLTAAP
jgi:catechol 2,3-dioxygenase-like lactoylglutathione lyase family enzyme